MTPAVLTQTEVAEKLRVSQPTFRRDRPALEAAGFQRPLPGLGAKRWSRAAVERWLDGGETAGHRPDPIEVLAERGKAAAAKMGRRAPNGGRAPG